MGLALGARLLIGIASAISCRKRSSGRSDLRCRIVEWRQEISLCRRAVARRGSDSGGSRSIESTTHGRVGGVVDWWSSASGRCEIGLCSALEQSGDARPIKDHSLIMIKIMYS
jgi:hypothetical protein